MVDTPENKSFQNPISSHEAIREVPQKAGGAVLSARFKLNDIGLNRAELMRAGNAAKGPIRSAIKRAVRNQYGRSGLKVRSGKLLGQALNKFKVTVIVKSVKIVVVLVEWSPTIEYFFIHLFGGIITPKTARALRFKIGNKIIFAQKVTIPKRNFLKFGAEARKAVELILERQIQSLITGRVRKGEERVAVRKKVERIARREGKRRPPAKRVSKRELGLAARDIRRARGDAAAVVRAKELVQQAGRRPTPFKMRKALRTGGLSPAEARRIVSRFTTVIGTGLLSQAGISALSGRLADPRAQAVITKAFEFLVFSPGGQ